MSVLVRVDGSIYSLLGDVDPNLVNGTTKSASFTYGPYGLTAMLTEDLGPLRVNLTFLNPIEVRFPSSVTFNVNIRIM